MHSEQTPIEKIVAENFSILVEEKNTELKTHDMLSIIYDAVQSTVGGIVITNNYGLITYVNPSFLRMFDYKDNAEVVGKNAKELIVSEEVQKFSDLKFIIDNSKGYTGEFMARRKSGEKFIVEVSASNVTNHKGAIIGRFASFIDISERKFLENEKETLIQKLQAALDNVRILKGMIPMCSSCKKIRDDKGFWHQVEKYVEEISGGRTTHGICPECYHKLYPELFPYKKN